MPRNVSTAIQNSFIGGFVTQATALDFPENAAIDQNNIVFSELGIAQRRFGMDFENNFTTNTLSNAEKAQSTYLWKNAAGDGNTNLVVQQNGGMLYFYNTGNALSLSAGLSPNNISLTSFQSSGSTQLNLDQNECQYSTGLGYLFVVHPYCDPFYILFNPSDSSFTASIITFTTRDTIGIPEAGVLINNRPTSLTANHEYNLLNQGWTSALWTTFHTAASAYPSNVDVWWTFNDDTDVFNPSTTLASVNGGSSPAPQGFFRLNPWNTARAATCTAQAGITLTLTGTVDQSSGVIRPSATEFHAGRVFYTGVNAPGYNSNIYFSKIIQQPIDFGACCSDDDPTSQTLFDFLPSDGGIIAIPQAGTIYKLVSIGATLLVFGANGVWAISGSTGIGFDATDYATSLVGLVRSISGSSFVLIDGSVAWWNVTGINIVTNDPQKGLTIQSMSDAKIKDFYLTIPTQSMRFARGVYNPRTHVLQWLYRTNPFSDITGTYTFDSVLNYNTLINAWYTWELPTDLVAVNSVAVIEGTGSLTGSNNVVDKSANLVVDQFGNDVITFGFSQTSITTTTKFLVYNGTAFTFAESFNVAYKDWTQFVAGGEDYDSFFTTGYLVKTQGERRFQTNYIFIFDDLTENSGEVDTYIFQALWNGANSGNSGKWTQRQTVSHTEANYDVGRRRLKVRGEGRSLQFKFSSVSGKPFNIIGWSTYDTANQAP